MHWRKESFWVKRIVWQIVMIADRSNATGYSYYREIIWIHYIFRYLTVSLFVLGLAGMDLTFLLADSMVLYFGFATKTMLVTHQCFVYYYMVLVQCQGFPFFPLCPTPQWVGWDQARNWKRTQTGQLTQIDQRDIPCHVMSCSAIKLM